jgi:hypothetical protein
MTPMRMAPVALLLALAMGGCGSAGTGRTPTAAAHTTAAHTTAAHTTAAHTTAAPTTAATAPTTSGAGNPPPFAWLRPAPPPSTWPLARLQGAGALAYPPGWHRIKSDPGTVSAALVVGRTGLVTEYLNATPKQANETLQNWASFRTAHNQEEGESQEQVLAAARDLRFRDGRGSCVIDRYRTTRTRYQEIACLVRAPAGETVVVAAALAGRWASDAPALERAVSAFVA